MLKEMLYMDTKLITVVVSGEWDYPQLFIYFTDICSIHSFCK